MLRDEWSEDSLKSLRRLRLSSVTADPDRIGPGRLLSQT